MIAIWLNRQRLNLKLLSYLAAGLMHWTEISLTPSPLALSISSSMVTHVCRQSSLQQQNVLFRRQHCLSSRHAPMPSYRLQVKLPSNVGLLLVIGDLHFQMNSNVALYVKQN